MISKESLFILIHHCYWERGKHPNKLSINQECFHQQFSQWLIGGLGPGGLDIWNPLKGIVS